MSISELLSFCEKRINFAELDIFCSIFTLLAIFIAAIFSGLFDTNIIENLVIADCTILHYNIEY